MPPGEHAVAGRVRLVRPSVGRGPDTGHPPVRVRTLLAGLAVRPLALSAWRAGVDAASVDLFGDRDHRRALPVLALRDTGADGYSARALVDLARRVEAREVAYGADLENHPDQVGRLAEGRRLLGNPPDVLRRVRDPFRVGASLREVGLPAPAVRRHDDPPPAGDGPGGWLRKPLRGGGGRGVRPWRPGEPVAEGAYLQRRIRGLPASLLFVADGRASRLLAATEMLVGRDAFGADGYTYCGSLLRIADRPPSPPGVTSGAFPWDAARRLAAHLAAEFGLVGLNGVDAVVAGDRVWPVEVNPRWTAAMELLEPGPAARDAPGEATLFETHRRACGGTLPAPGRTAPGRIARRWASLPGMDGPAREPGRGARAVVGKAILRTRAPVEAPDLEALDGAVLADVPEPGERVPAGGPVCTVLASAPDRERCLATLEADAARVREALRPGPA